MTRYVTNTEQRTFKECRRRWWLQFHRYLKPKTEDRPLVSPLGLGFRVHDALETHYTGGDALASIASQYESEELVLLAQQQGVEKEFQKEFSLAKTMLEGYLEWAAETGIDDGLKLVGVEHELQAEAFDGVTLLAKLDAMFTRLIDGSLVVRDYKTSGDFATLRRSLLLDEQVKFYLLIMALQDPTIERLVVAEWVGLRKVLRTATARPPFYERFQVNHNRDTLRSFWKQLVGTINRIVETEEELRAGADHHGVVPPNPTRDCHWKCPYYVACSLFDDGSDVERHLADHYEVGSQLDGRYATIDEGDE